MVPDLSTFVASVINILMIKTTLCLAHGRLCALVVKLADSSLIFQKNWGRH